MPERRRYALAMISAIDDGVGSILAKLREHGLEKNTLVIFTSDNGAPLKITRPDTPVTGDPGGWDGSLNDPWVGEKGMLSEGGIRVPMTFTWPGTLPAGKIYAQPVSSLDFAATANALAGLPADPQLDGVNVVPFFTGKSTGAPHASLCWRFWGQAAIREGRWKYLSAGKLGEFLFDMDSPNPEAKNLIASQPDQAAAMRKKLETWTQQFDPPGIPTGSGNDQETKWYQHYFNPPAGTEAP
jgi:arylsulfatase A-like enzyme